MFEPLLRPLVIPLAAAAICLLFPKRWEQLRTGLAVATTALTLVVVVFIFVDGDQAFTLAGTVLLRVDGLSRIALLATATFAVLIALYSVEYMRGKLGQRVYWACWLTTLSLACGALMANEFLLLLTCWGLLAVTLYLMIGLSGPTAAEAARKTFVIVGGSDALLLLAAVVLWVTHGTTRIDGDALPLDSSSACLAFGCVVAAAFAKAGAIPLHSWVPECGARAYIPVTAYLPASLDKLLGIYLLARAVTDLFAMTATANTVLMFLGALTILGAVMMALVQHNLKRLLAFHAVSQVGYMVLGLGTGTLVGLAGGLFHMLNHAIYKSCLFLGAGAVEEKTGTDDLDRLGGLATRLPVTFAMFLIAALSISGVPPLNGFASKWMVYQGVIESGQTSGNLLWVVWLAAAILGSALTLASFVKVLHSVFLCKPSPQVRDADIRPASWYMTLPMGILAGLCLLFGVFAHLIPIPWLIEPAVGADVEYPGTWWAARISALLLLTLLLGWGVYALTMRNGRFRRVPTFIGGERMDEARIPGVPRGPERHVEVTGVDFYQTVEQLPGLQALYRLARRKMFDLYEVSGRVTTLLVAGLRRAHSGRLPVYVAWFFLGLLIIVYLLLEGNPSRG